MSMYATSLEVPQLVSPQDARYDVIDQRLSHRDSSFGPQLCTFRVLLSGPLVLGRDQSTRTSLSGSDSL